jgi:hypothetical protein
LCSFEPFPGTSPVARIITAYLPVLAAKAAVVLIAGQAGGPAIETYEGARLQRVPLAGTDLRARIEAFERAVKRQLESEQPAIVHLMDPFSGYSVFQQKPRFSFKVIFDAQALASEALLTKRKDLTVGSDAVEKIQKRERFCLTHADRVVGLESGREALLSLGARKDRLRCADQPWAGEALLALYEEFWSPPAAEPPPLPDDPASTFKVSHPRAPSPTRATTRRTPAAFDVSDEVTLVDVPAVSEPDAGPSVDPWLAQLAHGYCPPEDSKLQEHLPATNFPGRRDTPPPIPPRKR